MLLKNYQILSEDARCNLQFLLQNVSGYDHVACRGYYFLFMELSKNDAVLRLHLHHESVWSHLIGLAAAAKVFGKKLEFYLDQKQSQLDVSKLYSLYVAGRFGAHPSMAPLSAQISEISDKALQGALELLSAELCTQMEESFRGAEIAPRYIVFPYETSVFKYADLCAPFMRCVGQKYTVKPTTEPARPERRDFTCWVQTMDPEANYGCFYFYISGKHQETISQAEIVDLMKYLPVSLVPAALPFKNQDELIERLIQLQNERFNASTAVQPKQLLTVTHSEVLQVFKTFLNTTHTLATDMFLTPLTAVMSYKFRFQTSDTVVCFVTGALTTNQSNHDFASFVDQYLYDSLYENCEIISIHIRLDPTMMSQAMEVMEVFRQNGTVIQHWNYTSTGVTVMCYSPGYDALTRVQLEIEKRLGRGSFQCDDMPKHGPQSQRPQLIDYSAEKAAQKTEYVSDLADVDQVTPGSIEAAYERLQSIKATDKTLVVRDQTYSGQLNTNIFLVMENIQQTGSFKIRGASNMLIKAAQQFKEKGQEIPGVVACSAGNHAQGVAKTSNLLGIKCTIVVPESAPETKLYNTLRYNAEVIKHGPVFDKANTFAMQLAAERGWIFVPPYNSFDVIQGQGTIAYELLKQVPNIDQILVNVGGGGMISGIALYAKKVNPKIKIIGIQASRVFPLKDYNQTGKLTTVDTSATTIADGCNVKFPGGIHNEILHSLVDEYACVDENDIAATIVSTLLTTKTLSEGAGCMGLTALLTGKVQSTPAQNTAVIVCGGNIDCTRLQNIYKLGTVSMGRRLKAKIQVPDVPGKLLQMFKTVQRFGGVIDSVRHTRNEKKVDWDTTLVTFEARMSCVKATQELKRELQAMYPNALFPMESLIPE